MRLITIFFRGIRATQRKVFICLFVALSCCLGLLADDLNDFYPGVFTVCFNSDMLGNTRGDFSITYENGIVRTPFEWFNKLADEFQIVKLTQKYRVKNQEWHLNGRYPSNVFRIEVSSNQRNDSEAMGNLIDSLRSNNHVIFAEKEAIYRTFGYIPNDPAIPQQWALEKVQAFDAWEIQKGSPDIVIGIVDSGLKWDHIDLADNIWINEAELPGITINWETAQITGGDGVDNDGNGFIDDVMGWDFWTTATGGETNNPWQSFNGHWHGTHVAGIAAAVGDNGIGMAGLAFNSKLIATKHSPFNIWSNSVENPYAGIYYMVDTGIRIINCSWGGSYPGAEEEANLVGKYALDNGSLIIAAAGNSNTNFLSYPAGSEYVFAVASTTQTDQKSSFSNFGTWVDISAPGSEIYSTYFTSNGVDAYESFSGTSMAAPMVSGLAALILSEDPDLSVEDLIEFIKEGADSIDHVNPQFFGQMGAGRINAFNSIQLAQVFDFDLNARNISGPSTIIQENVVTYAITIRNRGNNPATGYSIQLKQEYSDIPLVTLSGVYLEQGDSYDFLLNWIPIDIGPYQLYGQIVWDEDENQHNDRTNILSINVLPEGLTEIKIGDPESIAYINNAFVNYYWGNGLTQTIYLKEELNHGLIYSMTVNISSFGDIRPSQHISLYMANTNQSSFENNNTWIPYVEFTQVYSGILSVSRAGFYEIDIVFPTPFEYSSGNLAVMAIKETQSWFNENNSFQFTETEGFNRTLFWRSDWLAVNVDNFPVANGRLQGFTNAKFFIDTEHSSEHFEIALPFTTTLHGNYPNPFNPETNISFSLATDTDVNIAIYNIRGQKVRSLLNDFLERGMHTIIWDGKDDNGRELSSGVYLYRLNTEEFDMTRRMVLLK
ncbi:MAG: S8 family serine peptidase [Candidatus Cloacimonetes bacterium]|nr:S8 family serine peptidase [Candidatus Cloacimonadota bacterium]